MGDTLVKCDNFTVNILEGLRGRFQGSVWFPCCCSARLNIIMESQGINMITHGSLEKLMPGIQC
jgi:hypothetical protein